LYASLNFIREIKSRRLIKVGHVAHVERTRNAYEILVEKPEGKRPLGRTRHRREDDIGIDLGELGCKVVDWMHLN
jgi:hypothetical protein